MTVLPTIGRMAEENSSTIRHRCHALAEKLRSMVKPDDIDAISVVLRSAYKRMNC